MFNAFTVDVEDYFQVSGFERHIPRHDWPSYPSRVEQNTERLLAMLDARGVTGTFFILGWIAERFPQIVRRIHDAGHEIGSHSHWHRRVFHLTPDQFREDLRRSCAVLESITGTAVRSYRAPSFSVVSDSRWALEILAEQGIHIDSSIYPVAHDHYGIPDAETAPQLISTPSGAIWETPPAVFEWGRRRWPAGGGGYFRLAPWRASRFMLRQIYRRRPFVFYIHPWELDPEQPRLRAGSRAGRFRHYVNLHSTPCKLELLLQHFRFTTLSRYLGQLTEGANEQAAAGHGAGLAHR